MIDFKKIISSQIADITNIDANELITYIEIPPNSEMGDFAFPCFKLAKELKKSPPMIANEIKEVYKENEYITKLEVVGGYLNFYINKQIFIKDVMTEIFNKKEEYGSSEIGKGKTAVIEYSSPNIAKPFHIGHLRTTVIGGALYKIYKFAGYDVIGINHLGDWGIQFGKVMAGISLWKDEYNLDNNNPDIINEILKIYVRFSKEEKEDETGKLNDLARQWFIKLEAGKEEAVKLWSWIREISLKEYEKTYNLLNSKFDSYNGEAFYNDKMQAVVDELKEKELLEESQGAQVVNLEKYDMPPCIVITSTGTTIYATRDLAAFMYRMKEYNFDKLVYVVGGEQQLHFKQIFKVLDLMGYEDYVSKTEHVSFGLVVDKNGEKIGSRKGNSVSLEDILQQSISKVTDIINTKNPNIENKDEIARKIGVGAIIFNDLSASRIKDEIFDWDTILNFNGETGPYVQFMYVRTRSILEKTNTDISSIDNINFDLIEEKEAIEIIKLLSIFENTIINSMQKNEPSILTRYIIELAQAFSSYYAKYTIICEDKEIEKTRLLLTKQVGDVIKKGMELLGIDCPEKM